MSCLYPEAVASAVAAVEAVVIVAVAAVVVAADCSQRRVRYLDSPHFQPFFYANVCFQYFNTNYGISMLDVTVEDSVVVVALDQRDEFVRTIRRFRDHSSAWFKFLSHYICLSTYKYSHVCVQYT